VVNRPENGEPGGKTNGARKRQGSESEGSFDACRGDGLKKRQKRDYPNRGSAMRQRGGKMDIAPKGTDI